MAGVGVGVDIGVAAPVLTSRGVWYVSFASWNVKSAVRTTISRPLRSAMSKLIKGGQRTCIETACMLACVYISMFRASLTLAGQTRETLQGTRGHTTDLRLCHYHASPH